MLLAVLTGVAGWTASVHAGSNSAPPNLVLLVVDDMGWTGPSSFGSDLHATPHIDALAEKGVKFTRAYAAAPVCTPTRASIMTGQYPARLDMTIWHEAAKNPPAWQKQNLISAEAKPNLPLRLTTLPEALRQSGYRTVHIGKWHLGNASHFPLNHGFDRNIGGTHWGAPATYFFPYRGQTSAGSLRYVPDLPHGDQNKYLTEHLTDKALSVLDRAARKEKPLFLHMAYHTVHTPIQAPASLIKHYKQKLEPGMTHQNAVFAAMHHVLDRSIGRILNRLNQNGMGDETAIILVSDNGGFVNKFDGKKVTNNAPLRSGKGSLYEGGIRVPMIIHWPGVTRSGVCDEPVITNDLYPTLLRAAGMQPKQVVDRPVDGTNLIPLLKNPQAELPRSSLYWHYPHYYPTTTPVSAMRHGSWKLLHYYENDRLELYNLAKDFDESDNLVEERPEKRRALKARLDAWRDQVRAKTPKPNDK
jgi:arylsulfatase A-like enzyme